MAHSDSHTTQENWLEINNQENIKVFSTHVDGSNILKIKAVTVVDASFKEIQAILDDVGKRHIWIPYLQSSRIIEKISDTENIEYSYFSAPWPASNRDFVYSIKRTEFNASSLIYQMTSTQHPSKSENEDLIRAELMTSTYILSRISEQKTQVELIYHADPKGWLPNWIINIIQKILPFKILRNLKHRLDLQQ